MFEPYHRFDNAFRIYNNFNSDLFMPENSRHKPIAILVLYQPGHRFKLKKYFLKLGKNHIGSHHKSEVIINGVDSATAAITITNQLIYIQSFEPEAVHIPSNLLKQQNLMIPLQKKVRYIMQMEKDFIICRHKAIMQILTLKELLQVRNVQNRDQFIHDIDQHQDEESQKTEKLEVQGFQGTLPLQNDGGYQATIPLDDQNRFEATIPIQEPNFEGTLVLDRTSYQPTMLLNEQNNFEATLPLENQYEPQQNKEAYHNSSMLKSGSRFIKPSQFGAINASLPSLGINQMNSIVESQKANHRNKSNKKAEESIEDNEGSQFSMPDTIRQDQMPETIRQSQMMPETIKQEDFSHSKPKRNLTMSMPIGNKKSTKNIFHKYSSYPQQKQEEQQKPINSFQDMFGNAQEMEPLKNSIDSYPMSLSGKKQEPPLNQSGTQKIPSYHDQELVQKKEDSQIKKGMPSSKKQRISQKKSDKKSSQKKLIKCGIACCKMNEIKSKQLAKKGYKVVDDPSEDFEMLLVGNNGLKLSSRLMISLIEGLQIKSVNWITDPNAKITGKLQGFPWQTIEKRKGHKKQIFKGKYYLQEQLNQEFSEILTKGGAQLITQLKKNHSKSNINIILDESSEQGKQLYQQKKNYKKWKFYKKRMIIESVLMGEETKEKYEIEGYEFN